MVHPLSRNIQRSDVARLNFNSSRCRFIKAVQNEVQSSYLHAGSDLPDDPEGANHNPSHDNQDHPGEERLALDAALQHRRLVRPGPLLQGARAHHPRPVEHDLHSAQRRHQLPLRRALALGDAADEDGVGHLLDNQVPDESLAGPAQLLQAEEHDGGDGA